MGTAKHEPFTNAQARLQRCSRFRKPACRLADTEGRIRQMRQKRTPIQTGSMAHLSSDELAALPNDSYLVHRFADGDGWTTVLRGVLVEHEDACAKRDNPRLVSTLRCRCDCKIMRRVDDTTQHVVVARYSDFLTKPRTRKAKC